MNTHVPVIWREQAFSGDLHRHVSPAGLTIAQIVETTPGLDIVAFSAFGIVTIEGYSVDRQNWHRVRPKPGAIVNLCVSFPQKGSFGKVLRTVAVIAIAALAVAATGGAFAAGGFFLAGSASAYVLGAGISIAGTLALSAFTPPPQLAGPAATSSAAANGIGDAGDRTASLAGNVLRPGGPIPRVIGTHRVFPPLATQPLVDLIDDDETVEGVFVLAGPHLLENIRNGETLLSDIDDVDYETREGWDDDTGLTLVTRQSKTTEPGLALSEHITDPDSTSFKLDDQSVPENSVPQWHQITVKGSPDEIWLNFGWPQGVLNQSAPTSKMGMPLRIRLREVGSTDWTYLPEFHVWQSRGKTFQKQVKLIFGDTVAAPTAKSDRAFALAYLNVPMRIDRKIETASPAWSSPASIFANNKAGTPASNVVGGAATIYLGANFANSPRAVKSFTLWPDATNGFVSGAGSNLSSIRVYGKTSAPASATDGDLLWTYAGSETTSPISGTSADTATKYAYVWVTIATTAACTVYLANFQIYDDGEFSWKASDYFWSATETSVSNPYMNTASGGLVQNVGLYYERAEVYLNSTSPDVFPQGDYEIEIKRGTPYTVSQLTVARYLFTMNDEANAGIADFFKYNYGSASLYYRATNANNFADDCQLTRISSIWNEPVLSASGLATIAVRSRRRRLESINLDASGYVDRWGGTAWDDSGISSNPADHYRDVLVGDLNASALPETLIDDNALLEWRDHCVAMGYTTNMVCEGRSAFDVLNALAGCGRGRPRQSDKWSIMFDRDRAGETPVQVWSPANMRGFNWTKAFNRLPAGLRVRYKDSTDRYLDKEVIVLRPGAEDDGRYEDMPYDGIVTEADATARGNFDLAQMTARPVLYQGEVPLNHLVAERGDLVAVQYDAINSVAGWGRVRDVVRSGGTITGLVMYGSVAMNTAGQTGITIIGKNGSHYTSMITTGTSEEDTTSVDLVTPINDPGTDVIDEDCHVVTGEYGKEYKRLILSQVTPKNGMTASVVMLDEAPEIHDDQDPIILTPSHTPIYFGPTASASPAALTNAAVLALSQILNATGLSTSVMTFNCGGGAYPTIVFPQSFGTPTVIYVGGYAFSAFALDAMTVTDAYGRSALHWVLRFNTIQSGSAITVSMLP